MRMKQILSLLILIGLISCAPRIAVQPVERIPFPDDEYKKLASTGTAIIKGQAFLKTRGGDVKTAAGNTVLLNPVTSYSNQWYEVGYLQGKPIKEPDPRIYQYVKKQVADGSGRFTFKNVPAGDYYVTVDVFWEAPVGYQGSLVRQGGTLSEKIAVKEGEEIEIILTR